MTCEQARSRFMDFLYEEIDAATRQSLEAHLQTCSECRQEWEGLRETRALLQKLPQLEPESRLAFAAPPRRSLAEWWRDARNLLPQSGWARAAFGTVAALLMAIVAASIVNLHIIYDHGRFEVRAHLFQSPAPVPTPELQEQLLTRLRREMSDYIAEIHAAERAAQEEKLDRILTAFARDIERLEQQRENDLMLIGQELDAIHRVTHLQFGETNQMLQQLVQQISFQER